MSTMPESTGSALDRIPREDILAHPSGSVFVPDNTIAAMSQDELNDVNRLLEKTAMENPEYEFAVMRDVVRGGTIISWRRHQQRTEEGGSPQSISRW